jgi:hypothetical protein
MILYRQLDDAYRRLRRQPCPVWLGDVCEGGLDGAVAAIRCDRPDSTDSDRVLRTMVEIGRREPDAMTVVLYALAPKLRTRLARTVTDEYRTDALTDLAFVLLDSSFDGARLAARIVNRAHNRAYKGDRRSRTHGTVNVMTVSPREPQHFVRVRSHDEDVATAAVRRADLARFHAAVRARIGEGRLSPAAWAAYRDHRLRRAIDPGAPVCSDHQRITASRAATKLAPLIDMYLHAA